MKVAILALLVVCLFASADKYVELLGKDSCAAKVISTIKPEITTAVAGMKSFEDKVELTALVSKAQTMMEACPQPTYSPANADIIEKEGIELLLASNCEKDAGIMLLLGDEIKKDPKNIPQDLILGLFEVILFKQASADCKQAFCYAFPERC